MPTELNMVHPAFKISLTAAESLEMGRLALVWGQIDHLITMAVTKLLTVDANAGAIVTKE